MRRGRDIFNRNSLPPLEPEDEGILVGILLGFLIIALVAIYIAITWNTH